MSNVISTTEELMQLESVIARGKRTFVEVGEALAKIRDRKLFKPEFDSFEVYCREKWGWAKSYAYNLISAAEVAQDLPETVSTIVETESQARELSKVQPEARVEVVEKAQAKAKEEERPMTARDIREAAKPEPEPQPEHEEPPRVRSGPVITGDDVAIKLARLGAWRKELLVGEILGLANAMEDYNRIVEKLAALTEEME